MELAAPGTAQGNCATDNLVITPGATNAIRQQMPPTLCGTNTGHHGKLLYLLEIFPLPLESFS